MGKFYGNWGGRLWSGGGDIQLGEEPNWDVPGTDPLDEAFKNHDRGYWEAEQGDPANYWKKITTVDEKLMSDLEALLKTPMPGVVDPIAAEHAWIAFYFKRKFVDIPNRDGSSVPAPDGDPFTGLPWPGTVDPTVNRDFTAARNLVIRRDPLVLDLDGDGLELLPASGAILFDHNADGIKTGTGWVHPNDGFLVRDLNGNGVIDTGRELFGEDTLKSNGALAAEGFDALRELDSNSDGQITNLDTAFNELKVWRDLNQDGISQANELSTLGQLNITSINTNGTDAGPQARQLINNNRVALSSTFTQNTTDGQVSRTVGAIDLEFNTFFAQFPLGEPVAITAQAQGLPQMNGAGVVRDIRAAANNDSWRAIA